MLFIKRLDLVCQEDMVLVGGKAYHLGQLIRAGINVPPGFAITTVAWQEFMSRNGLDRTVSEAAGSITGERATELSKSVMAGEFPPDLLLALRNAYRQLRQAGFSSLICRSSAVAEDGAEHSFAGQFESVANIRDFQGLLWAVKRCWASAFRDGLAAYTQNHGGTNPVMGLVLQALVESAVAGVAFSTDPISGEQTPVVESTWGLGEVLVQGLVTPDRYVIHGGQPCLARLGDKGCFLRPAVRVKGVYPGDLTTLHDPWSGRDVAASIMLVDTVDHLYYVETPREFRQQQSLPSSKVAEVGAILQKLSDQIGRPQDMEFAINASGHLFIVQLRPATALPQAPVPEGAAQPVVVRMGDIIFDGDEVMVVAPGRATGHAAVISGPEEIDAVREGDILVTLTTTPAYVPAMIRAAGIVSADGGMLSHTAIVSRELGKPCLTVTAESLAQIHPGDWVTVDSRAHRVVVRGQVGGEDGHPPESGHLNVAADLKQVARQLGIAQAHCYLAQYVSLCNSSDSPPVHATAHVVAAEELQLFLLDSETGAERLSALEDALVQAVTSSPATSCWFVEIPRHRNSFKAKQGRMPWSLDLAGSTRWIESLHRAEFWWRLQKRLSASAVARLQLIDSSQVTSDLPFPVWNLVGTHKSGASELALADMDLALVFPHNSGWRAHILRRGAAPCRSPYGRGGYSCRTKLAPG